MQATPPSEMPETPSGPETNIQLHRVTWMFDKGLTIELECLHAADAAVPCDKPLFESLKADEFMETHLGGKVPLRSGTVKSWWAGEPGAAQLWWDYADAPAPAAALPPVPDAPSSAPVRLTGLFGEIAARRPRHLHEVRLFLDDGWFSPEMTCLHPQEPDEAFCDKDTLVGDGMLQYLHQGRGELRDGTIESWWETIPDESELIWKYADKPEPTGT